MKTNLKLTIATLLLLGKTEAIKISASNPETEANTLETSGEPPSSEIRGSELIRKKGGFQPLDQCCDVVHKDPKCGCDCDCDCVFDSYHDPYYKPPVYPIPHYKKKCGCDHPYKPVYYKDPYVHHPYPYKYDKECPCPHEFCDLVERLDDILEDKIEEVKECQEKTDGLIDDVLTNQGENIGLSHTICDKLEVIDG